MTEILIWIIFLYCMIQLSKTLLSLVYVQFFSKKYGSLKNDSQTKVTILQPIMSGDNELKRVLEKNVQELQSANFLWLVDLDDAEAIRITEQIQKAYPSQNIKVLFCPPCPEGINPKLFKFNYAKNSVHTENVIVLDDDTFLPLQTFLYLNGALKEFELVTGLPCYLDNGKFPSRLLAQFVNNNSAMTYLPLSTFMPPVSINGMCYSLKTKTIEAIQNFEPILNHLTDDLALAKMIQKNNGKILQLPQIQYIQTSVQDMKHYFRLMHRWFFFAILLLRKETIGMNLLIFLLQGVAPFLFIASILIFLLNFHWTTMLAFTFLLLFRSIFIMILQFKLTKKLHHNFIVSIISEILQPFHLIHASLVHRIVWRKRKYRVYDNDHFVSINK